MIGGDNLPPRRRPIRSVIVVAQTVEALGEVGTAGVQCGRHARTAHESAHPAFAEQVRIHLVGANRLATANATGRWRRRVTSSSSDPMWACANARIWVPLRASGHIVSTYGVELEGTGVHLSGPADRMGWQLSARLKSAHAGLGHGGQALTLLATQRPGTRYRVRRKSAAQGVSW